MNFGDKNLREADEEGPKHTLGIEIVVSQNLYSLLKHMILQGNLPTFLK